MSLLERSLSLLHGSLEPMHFDITLGLHLLDLSHQGVYS